MKCSWKRRCGDADDWVSDEPTGTTPSRDSLSIFVDLPSSLFH